MFHILKRKLLNNCCLLTRRFDRNSSGKVLSHIYDDNIEKEISKLTDFEIINHSKEKVYFKSYSVNGFTLSNNFKIIGGVTALSNTILFWNVLDIQNVNEESLELISVLEPKLDIVIIGKGPSEAKPDIRALLQLSKRLKINFEILPTVDALATFNFLNYEDRSVAAFLLPVKSFAFCKEDEAEIMTNRRKSLDMFRDSMADLDLHAPIVDRNFLFPSNLVQISKGDAKVEIVASIVTESKKLYADLENNEKEQLESGDERKGKEQIESAEENKEKKQMEAGEERKGKKQMEDGDERKGKKPTEDGDERNEMKQMKDGDERKGTEQIKCGREKIEKTGAGDDGFRVSNEAHRIDDHENSVKANTKKDGQTEKK